jgi:hypothetical protein
MPKRAPTPETGEDSKFFVVSYPYPQHAKMSVHEEKTEFARWISCIIDKDSFIAIYHKPSVSVVVKLARATSACGVVMLHRVARLRRVASLK